MANFNFNKVILGGRLTADPELKTTPSGVAVTTFNIAINRRCADKTAEFITVVAWRKTAEFITRYFRKASSICVVGVLETRSYVDKMGVRYEKAFCRTYITYKFCKPIFIQIHYYY